MQIPKLSPPTIEGTKELAGAEVMPFYKQSEEVDHSINCSTYAFQIYCGTKDMRAFSLGLGLTPVCSYQIETLEKAKQFALEMSKAHCISTREKREVSL